MSFSNGSFFFFFFVCKFRVKCKGGGVEGEAYSMFVFISRCSMNCTLSSRPALIFASSFSIFSICASEATFCVDVTYVWSTLNMLRE